MWVFAHDLSVFAGPRFAFIRVDDEIAGLGVFVPIFEVHKRLWQSAFVLDVRLTIVAFIRTHFIPDGNPAPPRPRRPEALISAMSWQAHISIAIDHARHHKPTNPVMTFQYYLLRLIPVAVLHCTLQIGAMMPIKILKYPILVLQPAKMRPLWWPILHRG